MVRATTASVLIRMGGTYWVNYDATNIGNMCTSADSILDNETHPNTLGTGTKETELATDIVMRLVAVNDWGMAGGASSGQFMPTVITKPIKDTIDRLSVDVTFKGFTAGKQQADS